MSKQQTRDKTHDKAHDSEYDYRRNQATYSAMSDYAAALEKINEDENLVLEAQTKAIRNYMNIRDGIIIAKRTVAAKETTKTKSSMQIRKHSNTTHQSNPASNRKQKHEIQKRQMDKRRRMLAMQRLNRQSVLAKIPVVGGILDGTLGRVGRGIMRAVKTVKAALFMMWASAAVIVILLLFSPFIFIMGLFSGSAMTAGIYLAEDECLNNAYIHYTRRAVDLKLEILNVSIGGVHEVAAVLNGDLMAEMPLYEMIIHGDSYHAWLEQIWLHGDDTHAEVLQALVQPLLGAISHNPHSLMAFLTIGHEDFTYPAIRTEIDELFDMQYQFFVHATSEIRFVFGNGVQLSYERRRLELHLHARSMEELLLPLLDDEQMEHYYLLMESLGGRQWVGSPFDFNWLPFVSSHYGYRLNPFGGTKQLHRGVDIALPGGTPIQAAHSGVVTIAEYSASYGNWIEIFEERIVLGKIYYIHTRYAHLDTMLVTVGDAVTQGMIIGTVGTTGMSTGNHLHFEVWVGGVHLNPVFFAEVGGDFSVDFE